MITRDEFEVRNERGVVLYTTDCQDIACKWAKARTHKLPGVQLVVERVKVTVIEERKSVYRPKPFVEECAA